jgi:hypothetical protein
VGAVVIVAGVVIGVRAATSHPHSAAASNRGANAARNGPPGGGGTTGTLTAVNSTVLTVTTADGRKVTVHTSTDTTVLEVVTAALADVKVGDRVTVRGTASAPGGMTAQQIADTGTLQRRPGAPVGGPGGPPGSGAGGPGGGFTAGTVSGVSGDTITVTAFGGAVTSITTTPTTTVTTVQPSSISALVVGQTVRVVGPTGSDGSVTASTIQEGAGGFIGFGGGPRNRTATTTG